MAYQFHEWDYEPETQPASGRAGKPPAKITGVDLLDQPRPPKWLPKLPFAKIVGAIALVFVIVSILSLFLLSH